MNEKQSLLDITIKNIILEIKKLPKEERVEMLMSIVSSIDSNHVLKLIISKIKDFSECEKIIMFNEVLKHVASLQHYGERKLNRLIAVLGAVELLPEVQKLSAIEEILKNISLLHEEQRFSLVEEIMSKAQLLPKYNQLYIIVIILKNISLLPEEQRFSLVEKIMSNVGYEQFNVIEKIIKNISLLPEEQRFNLLKKIISNVQLLSEYEQLDIITKIIKKLEFLKWHGKVIVKDVMEKILSLDTLDTNIKIEIAKEVKNEVLRIYPKVQKISLFKKTLISGESLLNLAEFYDLYKKIEEKKVSNDGYESLEGPKTKVVEQETKSLEQETKAVKTERVITGFGRSLGGNKSQNNTLNFR